MQKMLGMHKNICALSDSTINSELTKGGVYDKSNSTQAHHNMCISPVLWLTPSISSVGEVRLLLFSVCFLLWLLLSYVASSCHLAAF